ncbi:hypothetical protein PHET_07980 [Paragonimus heterotremus]|uniref:Uncharacterized protein n=1 Tax=Paragonimus heterotremus TaxID=100268 RepID=A0A8J4WFP5_9TREM|nr:hypothetical protein PHET_07980 [Paragonimus heterotremus]
MRGDGIGDEPCELKADLSACLKQQPEFAALCSFIHHFGADLGIYLTFPQLIEFLSLSDGANWRKWETLHIKLLNKLKYRARPERWEPVLGRFLQIHTPNMSDLMDAAERLQHGTSVKSEHATSLAYYSLSAATRTKVLLSLLESQFDRNQGFKDKVNVRPSVDLRFRPLGADVWGRIYWLLKDSEVNVLLYREDTEDETILLICENTNEIRELHDRLKDVCPSEPNLATILASRKRASPSDGRSPLSTGLTSVVTGLITAQIASTESDQIDQKCLLNGLDPEVSRSPPLPSSPSTPPPTPISCTRVPTSFSDIKTQELFLKLENAEAEENTVSSK